MATGAGEEEQIYLRNLERVIRPENYTAPIDLSDVVLKQVKQIDRGRDRYQPRDASRPVRRDGGGFR